MEVFSMASTAFSSPDPNGYLRLVDVARRIGKSYMTCWKWCVAGRWAGVRRTERGIYLVPETAVQAFLASGLKRPPLECEEV